MVIRSCVGFAVSAGVAGSRERVAERTEGLADAHTPWFPDGLRLDQMCVWVSGSRYVGFPEGLARQDSDSRVTEVPSRSRWIETRQRNLAANQDSGWCAVSYRDRLRSGFLGGKGVAVVIRRDLLLPEFIFQLTDLAFEPVDPTAQLVHLTLTRYAQILHRVAN